MNGASKILTVSYGTFSCTLEGFDDPFNTMKAIAEYFRDLAAEDRYFGAEPPTPDAAMLHRIAEREIQRRVEAKIGDNGVVLRAEEGATPKVTFPAQAQAPAPQPVAAPVAPAAPAPVLASAAEAAPAIESAAVRLSRLRAAQAHSVQVQAAPVQAPAVAPAPVAAFAPPLASASPTYIDVQDASEDQDLAAADAASETALAQAAKALADQEKAALKEQRKARKAAVKDTPVEDAAIVSAPEAKAADDAASTDLLAKIARAAAVPAPAEVEPVAEVAAEVPATPAVQTPELSLDGLTASIRETLAGFGSGDDQLAVDMHDVDSEAVSEATDDTFDDILPEDHPAVDSALIDDYDQIDAAPVNLNSFPEAELIAGLPEVTLTAPVEADSAPAAVAESVAAAKAPAKPKAEAELVLPPNVVAEKIQRARARVIKIRRLDTVPTAQPLAEDPTEAADLSAEAAIPVAEIPEFETAELESAAPETPVNAAPLSAEAEADLESELAALEAELGGIEDAPVETAVATAVVAEFAEADDEVNAAVSAAEPDMTEAGAVELDAPEAELPEAALPEQPLPPVSAAPEPHAEPHRLPAVETGDAAVNRLLEKANTEFEVPETKRRRSAIAHLKAAVLATVAERRINPNSAKPDAERMDPYRQDLNQVVRPATGERPAPLVLVSSQRIDRTPEPAQRPQAVPPTGQPALVRPRRVTAGLHGSAAVGMATIESVNRRMDEVHDPRSEGSRAQDQQPEDMANIFADPAKQSFQEFADALGAHSMQDLIEAAGAYCTLVLGQESFTRPLLFRQIESLPGHQPEAAREDGLRGFGRLLRDGRLTKTKRGQYILAETSPILTEARRQAN